MNITTFKRLADVDLPKKELWYTVVVPSVGYTVESFDGESWDCTEQPTEVLCFYGVPIGWEL